MTRSAAYNALVSLLTQLERSGKNTEEIKDAAYAGLVDGPAKVEDQEIQIKAMEELNRAFAEAKENNQKPH